MLRAIIPHDGISTEGRTATAVATRGGPKTGPDGAARENRVRLGRSSTPKPFSGVGGRARSEVYGVGDGDETAAGRRGPAGQQSGPPEYREIFAGEYRRAGARPQRWRHARREACLRFRHGARTGMRRPSSPLRCRLLASARPGPERRPPTANRPARSGSGAASATTVTTEAAPPDAGPLPDPQIRPGPPDETGREGSPQAAARALPARSVPTHRV